MTDLSPAAVDAAVARAQALVEQLCRQPSVAVHGLGMAEMANLTEAVLHEAGFATRRLTVPDAPPIVYGEQTGHSPFTLLLYNHYDVQPAEPLEPWESPPFEPTVRDGKLYARGAADNKGELAARLAAVHALRDADGGLPIGIRWLIEGEEEVGSPHFAAIIAPHAPLLRAGGCLWEGRGFDASGRPMLVLGRKGVLTIQLEVETLATDAHSSLAPVLPSAAWRLVGALGAIRSPDGGIRLPGFYEAVRPPTSAELAALADQAERDAELRAAFGAERFVDGVAGQALLERLSFAPTCNIQGLAAGYGGPGSKTIVPARATAKLDFRLVPDQDPQAVLAMVRAHLDAEGYGDVRLTTLAAAEPYMTALDDPFARRVAAIAEAHAGRPASITPLGGGTLPLLAALHRAGAPSGLSAPGNPIYPGTGTHAPNEHIRLDDLRRAVAFTLHLLRALGEPEEHV